MSDKTPIRESEQPANTGVLVNCAFSEMATVADLIHHPKNPNQHSEGQLDFIRKVIEHQGWRSPLIISNLSGFVVCGNGRLMAARLMGLETVPIDRQDFANEADEIAHLLADNKIASMAELDNDILKGVLSELDTGAIDMDLTGFADAELEELMTQFHVDEENDAEPKIDQAEELQKKWGTKLGQVWELGDHRIACGDSIADGVAADVLGNEKAAMVFTDPPYNIDYGNIKHPKFRERSIENDDKTPEDWATFCEKIAINIAASTDGCIYVCHAPNQDGRAIASVLDAHFHCSTTIIWNKDVFTLGRGKYHNKYEPIWFGWVKSGKAFTDRRDLPNVWDFARPRVSKLHPTIKPVELVGRAIEHASKVGNLVYDPFLGSGTTLIACENLGRKCRAIELAPEYVAVSIQRWVDVTGKEPQLVDG